MTATGTQCSDSKESCEHLGQRYTQHTPGLLREQNQSYRQPHPAFTAWMKRVEKKSPSCWQENSVPGGDDSLHPRSLRLKYHGNCSWGIREKGDLAPCALDRDCAGPTGVDLRAKWAVDGVLADANLCHGGVRAPGTWSTSPASTLDFCRWQAPGQAENKKGQVEAWRRHWAQRKAPDHTLCGPPEEGVGMEGRQRQREPG